MTTVSNTRSYCSFTQIKKLNGIEITVNIDENQVKFNLEDANIDLEEEINHMCYDFGKCFYGNIEQIISTFGKLVIFLYNGAVTIGYEKFHQEVKTIIKNTVVTIEKGIQPIMQKYKAIFYSFLEKGTMESVKIIHGIFYEGIHEQYGEIYGQIMDILEKFYKLKKGLDEATKLGQYNTWVIDMLEMTISCCIECTELLCKGGAFLFKSFEDYNDAYNDPFADPEDLDEIAIIAIFFFAIEKCQALIEITENMVQNIKQEIDKKISVEMAKATTRHAITIIPTLTSSCNDCIEEVTELCGNDQ